ncbi:hypothetical protein [Ekhidna sp.]|uniref:hypothetical protein n=1 Tax=Ekhidna sp. TaxID=2608089 RepID=UPI0035130B84
MKKLILASALVACFSLAIAQTDQGGLLLSASTSLGFASTSYDAPLEKTSNFDLEVGAGYFLINNLAVGLNARFEKEKQGDDETTTKFFGPFARYYINGGFFVGASYARASLEEVFARAGNKIKFSILAFEAGYPIWIVEKVAIEPSLNYGIASGSDIINSKTLGFNIGFSIYF